MDLRDLVLKNKKKVFLFGSSLLSLLTMSYLSRDPSNYEPVERLNIVVPKGPHDSKPPSESANSPDPQLDSTTISKSEPTVEPQPTTTLRPEPTLPPILDPTPAVETTARDDHSSVPPIEIDPTPTPSQFLYLRIENFVVKLQLFETKFRSVFESHGQRLLCVDGESEDDLSACLFQITHQELKKLQDTSAIKSKTTSDIQDQNIYMTEINTSRFRLTEDPGQEKKIGQAIEVRTFARGVSAAKLSEKPPGILRTKVKLYHTTKEEPPTISDR